MPMEIATQMALEMPMEMQHIDAALNQDSPAPAHAEMDTCCPDDASSVAASVEQTPTSCHCVGLCNLIPPSPRALRARETLRVVTKRRDCAIVKLDSIWRPPATL